MQMLFLPSYSDWRRVNREPKRGAYFRQIFSPPIVCYLGVFLVFLGVQCLKTL